MAKTKEANGSNGSASTALAVTEDEAALAALNEAGIESGDDGLGEFSPKDFRTPAMLFNLKDRSAADGTKVTQDLFFDSIEKTVLKQVNFALLEIHKSNAYQRFDKKEKRNVTVCSSFDQITGVMHDGTERPCKGCPDARWMVDKEDGKRKANCGEVWSCFCFDLDRRKVFMLRFKRTSLDSIRNYVQAHHYGKRPLAGGKRGNIPLYTWAISAYLEMDKSGNYAVPVLTKGKLFSSADLIALRDTSIGVRETLEARMREAEASADDAEGGGGAPPDTSFDTTEYDAQRGSNAFVQE